MNTNTVYDSSGIGVPFPLIQPKVAAGVLAQRLPVRCCYQVDWVVVASSPPPGTYKMTVGNLSSSSGGQL